MANIITRRSALLGAAASGLILPADASTIITRGAASAQAFGFGGKAAGPPGQTVTWSATNKTNITLSGANTVATSNNTNAGVRTDAGHSSGKYYAELVFTTISSGNMTGGIADSSWTYTSSPPYGGQTISSSLYAYPTYTLMGAFSSGGILGIALDATSGYMWYSKNGIWQLSGNPSTGANPAVTGLSGTYYLAFGTTSASGIMTLPTGAFAYTVPTGFSAW